MASRLLVVDWDFFIPVDDALERLLASIEEGMLVLAYLFLRDHGRDAGINEAFWTVVAGDLLGGELSLETSGAESTFWSRFTFDPEATLFVAAENDHALADQVRRDVDEVWLFDAHHDAGVKVTSLEEHRRQGATAGSWVIEYGLDGCLLKVRYPSWRAWALEEPEPIVHMDRMFDDGLPVAGAFDRVFVCRSDFYTPPWLDGAFSFFLNGCPAGVRADLANMDPRAIDIEVCRAFAQTVAGARTTLRAEAERFAPQQGAGVLVIP